MRNHGAGYSGWTVAAILLLVGADMVVEPEFFARLPGMFVLANREFGRRLRGPVRREMRRWHWEGSREVAPFRRVGVQVAGWVVIAAGLLAAAIS